MPALQPVSKALLLACVAIFALQELLPQAFELWFALWPLSSGAFMPWQMLSYAFLHGDLWHIFMNMLVLWMFGADLERLWGPRRFLVFIVASILAAAVVQLGWTAFVGSRSPTLGFSGAAYGLLLGFGMMFPNRTVVLLIPPIPMKAKYFVLLFTVLEVVLGVRGRDGIAHFAHLGGMVGGLLMILYWRGKGPFRRLP
jgi:membrane associated rhomboid family serine protease